MEAQRSLFKNNSYYGWFSPNACFSIFSFKRYNCWDLQDWFVDSRTIAAATVSQASEGRHYYCSIQLHKEGFDPLVQRRIEDTANKSELIHPNLLSNLSELRQRPSGKALENITNMKEYKELVTNVLITTKRDHK